MIQKLLLFLLLLLPLPLLAGKQVNHWYFGDHAGLDFTNGTPTALTNGAMFAAEGCASISDKDGNLLFYTDGITVWNRNHAVMENGTGLKGGGSTTQAALIVQRPGNNREYYIFTPDQAGQSNGLHYSIVDMSAENGLGKVVARNTPLVTPVSERITAVRHSNAVDVWVLVHGWNNSEFYAYLVTGTGVQPAPVSSTSGSFHGGDEGNAIGTMKLSTQGHKLVVTVPNTSSFEVFDFDATSGVVANPLLFPAEYPAAYGTEFSPDGSLVYVGVSGQKKGIYQFDLDAGSAAGIVASGQRIDNMTSGFAGALQLGPDGNIYVARLAEGFVAAITEPDARGAACAYIDHYVSLNGRSGRLGLPGFIQSDIHVPVRFTTEHHCLGEATVFHAGPDGTIDSVQWDFGDPATGTANTSTGWEPVHIFTSPGVYEVTLYTYVDGERNSFRQPVEIRPVPQISFGADTLELCAGALLTLQGAGSTDTFLWSTGETGAAIRVPGSGILWVQVSNGECETRDSVVVREGTFTLDVPGDTLSVCHGGTVRLQAGGAIRYEWTPAGTLDDPSSATPFATPSVSTLYTVRGWNDKGCEDERQIFVRVLPDSVLQFVVPDTLAVVGETRFSIPVLVRTNPNLLPLHLPSLTVELRLNTVFFEPELVTDGVMQQQPEQQERRITISLNTIVLTRPEQVLTSIQGIVLAGDTTTRTPIEMSRVVLNECEQRSLVSGLLAVQGCAVEQRQVGFGSAVRLSAWPNPTVDNLVIDVSTSLHDTYRLVLYTATGRAVWQRHFAGSGIGEENHSFDIAGEELPPGLYYAVLFSSGGTVSVGITVVR